jgi:hypothetical protein
MVSCRWVSIEQADCHCGYIHRAKPMPLILLRIIHRSTSGQGFRKYISRSPRNPFVL